MKYIAKVLKIICPNQVAQFPDFGIFILRGIHWDKLSRGVAFRKGGVAKTNRLGNQLCFYLSPKVFEEHHQRNLISPLYPLTIDLRNVAIDFEAWLQRQCKKQTM